MRQERLALQVAQELQVLREKPERLVALVQVVLVARLVLRGLPDPQARLAILVRVETLELQEKQVILEARGKQELPETLVLQDLRDRQEKQDQLALQGLQVRPAMLVKQELAVKVVRQDQPATLAQLA